MKLNDIYTVDDHELGAEVRIKDGNGKLTALWIKVKGADSVAYRKQLKLQKKKYQEALLQKRDLDEDDFVIEALSEIIIGWRGTDEEYSKELCVELLTKAPFVRDQIDAFMSNRANFTKAKRKKSQRLAGGYSEPILGRQTARQPSQSSGELLSAYQALHLSR